MSTSSTQVMRVPRVLDAERRRPPGELVIAEAGGFGAALAAAAGDLPHWSAGLAAAAVGVGLLAPVRGASGAARLRRRLHPAPAGAEAPVRRVRCGSEEYAVQRRGDRWAVLVDFAAPPPTVTVLPDAESPAVELGLLARMLELPDTPAARLTLFVDGARVPPGPEVLRADYLHLLGPITRWSRQRVTVCLEIDPVGCAAAIARRGGASAAALAGRRLVDRAAPAGLMAGPVTADDPRWLRYPTTTGVVLGLDAPAAPDGAAVTVGLEPAPEGVRLRLSAPHDPDAGHPFATPGPGPSDPVTVGPASALGGLRLPVTGCGQVIGADRGGRAVAARLHGPGVPVVELRVDDGWAVELLARAVATGARALVVTARPEPWEPLLRAVDDPRALWLAGQRHPRAADPVRSLGGYDLVFLDGAVAHPAAAASGTVWFRRGRDGGAMPPAPRTVTVTGVGPGRAEVRAGAAAVTATRVR